MGFFCEKPVSQVCLFKFLSIFCSLDDLKQLLMKMWKLHLVPINNSCLKKKNPTVTIDVWMLCIPVVCIAKYILKI